MSTTDHPDHTKTIAPQCPTPGPDPINGRPGAVALITTLDRTSTAEATNHLVALACSSGHHQLCVAHEVAHLADPTAHPHSHPGLGAVHPQWAPPLHQRRHGLHRASERWWAVGLGAAATHPTQPGPAGVDRAAVDHTDLDHPAAPARALHLVRTGMPVRTCGLPVAGHHRCPLYRPSQDCPS